MIIARLFQTKMKNIFLRLLTTLFVLTAQAQTTSDPFITEWKTVADGDSITIHTDTLSNYNYTVDWGDGSANTTHRGDATHVYMNAGTHTVTVSGRFPQIRFALNPRFTDVVPFPAARQIRTVKKWGDMEWTSMEFAFAGCDSLTIADDAGIPDLSRVTSMRAMFAGYFVPGADQFSPPSRVRTSLTGDLSRWNVSNVEIMWQMFENSSFNGDISNWNVSKVDDMQEMFAGSLFDGDLSNWDVSNVRSMATMFAASPFNGDISDWDVSSVRVMRFMFRESAFNGDISEWNVNSVGSMWGMFDDSNFNGDISEWNVGSVRDMSNMFRESPFNGDISDWNVSSVTDMRGMFAGSLFNGDISEWDIGNVTQMNSMFRENSSMSSENYDKLLVGWSTLSSGETKISDNIIFWPPRVYSCRGVAGRDTLNLRYSWNIRGDELVRIRTDEVVLSPITGRCEVTIADVSAPTATNNCEGTGTTVTAVRNIPDASFPIIADTVIIWTYTDAGKSIIQTQQVMIGDNTAPMPVVANLPILKAVCSLARVEAKDIPMATDNCMKAVRVTSSAAVFPITSDTTITWTYSDAAGNTATQTQQVVIEDDTSPMPAVADLPVLKVICSLAKVEAKDTPTATDNCMGTVRVTTPAAVFPITSDTTITWTYRDAVGNTVTQTQQVTIEDNMAPMPTIANLPAVPEQCQAVTESDLTAPTAMDNCLGMVRATTDASFPITSTTTITWTYTDNLDNTTTQMQKVNIDADKPVPDVTDLPKLSALGSRIRVPTPTATDDCLGIVRATTDTNFPITSTTIITWTYTDAVGNADTQTQEVTITPLLSATADAAESVIFPNPSSRYLEVRSPIEGTFKILSLSGKQILEDATNTRVDITSLKSGLYLVQLSNGRLLKFVRE